MLKHKIYIFALGNMGDKYKNTRHNAARIVCKDFDFANREIEELGFEIVYIEPECYMNESGIYIKKYLKNKNYFSEDKNDAIANSFIVCYDDKDIEIGKIKNSFARSGGGHNGIKNIITNLGTNEFFGIRIGIGPQKANFEGEGVEGQDFKINNYIENIVVYVLDNFSKTELIVLKSEDMKAKLKDNLLQILKQIKAKSLKNQ